MEHSSQDRRYGLNGSMRSTSEELHFETDSGRRVTLHSFDDLPTFETESLLLLGLQTQRFSIWQIGPTVRDLRRPKLMSTSGRSLQDNLENGQFGKHSNCLSTNSFCGLDHGKGWQHGTDLPSYRRIHRARCAITVINQPNISYSNALLVIIFSRIFDSSLASPMHVNPSQCGQVAQERE
ncbi:UNVERIFIED_CONTAM: hypothetical protein Sradi_4518400 [Sesamum radiatum]|uniref:Uncharacterized protein n=1 Tax=Sesamum radiatum TaxID=300843 RepID=A0AAW2NC63_SESRA